MSEEEFEKKLGDVAKFYRTPTDLIGDAALTREQQVQLLKQWQYDLQLLMTATEENMTGTGTHVTAERLKQVQQALKFLGTAPEKSGPGKVSS
ncbi:MAG TPA: hypothetical protein VHL08_05130 [Dongiaceae bacterium]|nr:hypothetical protein [Dongiaceae bacterium]